MKQPVVVTHVSYTWTLSKKPNELNIYTRQLFRNKYLNLFCMGFKYFFLNARTLDQVEWMIPYWIIMMQHADGLFWLKK